MSARQGPGSDRRAQRPSRSNHGNQNRTNQDLNHHQGRNQQPNHNTHRYRSNNTGNSRQPTSNEIPADHRQQGGPNYVRHIHPGQIRERVLRQQTRNLPLDNSSNNRNNSRSSTTRNALPTASHYQQPTNRQPFYFNTHQQDHNDNEEIDEHNIDQFFNDLEEEEEEHHTRGVGSSSAHALQPAIHLGLPFGSRTREDAQTFYARLQERELEYYRRERERLNTLTAATTTVNTPLPVVTNHRGDRLPNSTNTTNNNTQPIVVVSDDENDEEEEEEEYHGEDYHDEEEEEEEDYEDGHAGFITDLARLYAQEAFLVNNNRHYHHSGLSAFFQHNPFILPRVQPSAVSQHGFHPLYMMNRDFDERDYDMLLQLDEQVVKKKTVEASLIEKIPKIQVEEATSCSICLEDMEKGVTASEIPFCKHKFHSHCIEKWLKDYGETCPICKQSIREIDFNHVHSKEEKSNPTKRKHESSRSEGKKKIKRK